MRFFKAVAVGLFVGVPLLAVSPQIVAPDEVLHDAEIPIRIEGLTAGANYRLDGEFVTRGGTLWKSTARFVADDTGVIDLAADAPLDGTWDGGDPTGIFWSMTNTKQRVTDPSLFENDDRSVITLRVTEGEKAIASRRMTLRKRDIGISSTDIRSPIVGTLYVPYGKRNLPAVVVMGGSEGGVPNDRAALIASHGYVTLALAYFAAPGLSGDLEQIPLEYFDRALEWLAAQPAVDRKRIALLGVSKSAELALLIATQNHSIAGVVAIAPASIVSQSISDQRTVNSSWTRNGVDVPFAPFVVTEAFSNDRRLLNLYAPTLAAAPPESAIPVEKIRCPVLLLAGKVDQLWPSEEMAGQLVERAKQSGNESRVQAVIFDDAGHHVGMLPHRPTGDSVRLGGSAKGLDRAQIAAWKNMLRFLGETLGVPP